VAWNISKPKILIFSAVKSSNAIRKRFLLRPNFQVTMFIGFLEISKAIQALV
jgi:hypothetical protein